MSETSLPTRHPSVRLLLLGYGHVAQAFLQLLASRSIWLGNELGVRPVVCGLGTRSHGLYIYPRGFEASFLVQDADPFQQFINNGTYVDNAREFIEAGKALGATVLIELTTLNPQNGQPALSYIRTALQSDLDVITANKGPVAYAQSELQALAGRQNVQFRFEATVMDGLPLINLAQFTLQAVGIHSFRALLNTTSSLVMSMIEQGFTRDEAIAKAQELGIAEARPRKLSKDDILLVGKGTTSVISLETEAMGTITLVEHEPTVTQTAYGVLSDLVTILKQKAS